MSSWQSSRSGWGGTRPLVPHGGLGFLGVLTSEAETQPLEVELGLGRVTS